MIYVFTVCATQGIRHMKLTFQNTYKTCLRAMNTRGLRLLEIISFQLHVCLP